MLTINLFGTQEFYSERYGDEVVEIIKDSNPVDKNKLDANKVTWAANQGLTQEYRSSKQKRNFEGKAFHS